MMIVVQGAAPLADHARSTALTPKLSLADQRIDCADPTFQISPPSGEFRLASGGITSTKGAPELVKVSANPLPRTVSIPPGSHVAEMITCPFDTLSQAAFGAAPAPVSVQ